MKCMIYSYELFSAQLSSLSYRTIEKELTKAIFGGILILILVWTSQLFIYDFLCFLYCLCYI